MVTYAANYNELLLDLLIDKPNLAVPWYLSLSYAYYELDESLVTDWTYDRLCRMLDQRWDEIEHRHKHLIDRASLSAGTGFALPYRTFPSIILESTRLLIKNLGR